MNLSVPTVAQKERTSGCLTAQIDKIPVLALSVYGGGGGHFPALSVEYIEVATLL